MFFKSFLTAKILISRLNAQRVFKKNEWLALLDSGVISGRAYDTGKISKSKYERLYDKNSAEGDRLAKQEEASINSSKLKQGFFAFTRALQGHLQRQERNYQEQMIEMNRNQRIGSNNTCVIRCMRDSDFPNKERYIERCQDRCN